MCLNNPTNRAMACVLQHLLPTWQDAVAIARSVALGKAKKTEKQAWRWAETRRMISISHAITTRATATSCTHTVDSQAGRHTMPSQTVRNIPRRMLHVGTSQPEVVVCTS